MSDNSKEKQRLLIVDDSKVIRVTARKILRDHFDTIEAVDGENAWEILSSDSPVSLVVSDLTMPNLDGFGLLKRIRSSHLPHIRDLPVIIITGANDTESTMERARKDGATDFIGKPFDAVHLLARTQAHANAHAVTNTLKDENTALEELTTLDPLTGLANEAAFMERGYQLLSYAIRHDSALNLFRMEIDGYGAVYRKYGASFAESIIQTLAKILGESIRLEDTVARIGTARFALLLPGMNKAGVHSLAERINSGIAMRVFKSGNDKTNVTISIGVASPVIRRDMQLSELITAADECLSMAISRGGNQVIYDDDPVDTRTAVPTVRVTRSETNTHTRAVFAESRPTTTPASKANPFHREDVEVEEIEIFTADYPFAHFGAARHDRVEIKNRSGATPGHVPNTAAATVSGKAVFTSSPAASNAKPGIPSQPHVAAPAELTLTPINPADDAVTGISSPECEGEITAGPASPMTDLMKGSSDTVATPNGSSRVQPVKSRSTIKHARRAHRPGVLKRMLAWFGLARSPR